MYFPQTTGGNLPEYQEYSLCCPSNLTQILPFDDIFCPSENPYTKITGGDMCGRKRPCRWKMTVDHPCMCEMLSKQFLYRRMTCKEVLPPAWKWCLRAFYAVKVAELRNLSVYHNAQWRNGFPFGFHLCFSLQFLYTGCKVKSWGGLFLCNRWS